MCLVFVELQNSTNSTKKLSQSGNDLQIAFCTLAEFAEFWNSARCPLNHDVHDVQGFQSCQTTIYVSLDSYSSSYNCFMSLFNCKYSLNTPIKSNSASSSWTPLDDSLEALLLVQLHRRRWWKIPHSQHWIQMVLAEETLHEDEFRKTFRMTRNSFNQLHALLGIYILTSWS